MAHFSARVLVAEDNLVNQAVAVGMLQSLGCEVDVVRNGKEVLDALIRSSYDIVFMDCQMPEMDGFEATARIREMDGAGNHRAIIAMTANALMGDKEKCLEAGMDDYIPKPIRQLDLIAAIARASRSRTASEKLAK
jgi:CheY-like chemotaxis protein